MATGIGDYDKLETSEYVAGDLVVFTGHLFTPDFMYAEQFTGRLDYGIVMGHARGAYSEYIYRVYWFSHARIIETVPGHMRLAYVNEKDTP
jgi:hypothetical protein